MTRHLAAVPVPQILWLNYAKYVHWCELALPAAGRQARTSTTGSSSSSFLTPIELPPDWLIDWSIDRSIGWYGTRTRTQPTVDPFPSLSLSLPSEPALTMNGTTIGNELIYKEPAKTYTGTWWWWWWLMYNRMMTTSIYLWFLYLQVPSAAPGRNSDDGGVLPP